jgi:sugar phosphate permease
MLGTLYATNIAGYSPFGMEGWRAAFRTVAVAAMIIGLVVLVWVKDPRYSQVPRATDYVRVGSALPSRPTVSSGDSFAEQAKEETWQDVVEEFWLVSVYGPHAVLHD